MNSLAIDIVLLPSDEVINRAISVNKALIYSTSENFVLDKKNCVPHISLLMGVVNEENLCELENYLRSLVGQINKLNLKVNKFNSRVGVHGNKSNNFGIEKSKELQNLHENIVKKIGTFLISEISEECFITPPAIKYPTKEWVLDYIKTSAFEKFNPHISLGFGTFQGEFFPFNFTSSKIAVFQLGNYCICGKKLFELSLF